MRSRIKYFKNWQSNITFIFINICFILNTYAQEYKSFKNFTTSNSNISQNSIYGITQDKFGLIWVSSQVGIDLFDGINFTPFNNSKNKSYLIPSGRIINLFSNDLGVIVATKDSLSSIYYNSELNEFKTTSIDLKGKKGHIKKIVGNPDSTSFIVVTDSAEIFSIYVQKNKEHLNFIYKKTEVKIPSVYLFALFDSDKNQFLLGFGDQLKIFNSFLEEEKSIPVPLMQKWISPYIFEGRIYYCVKTRNNYEVKISKIEGGRIKLDSTNFIDRKISSPEIMIVDETGIYIGLSNGGVFYKKSSTSEHILAEKSKFILSMIKSSDNVLWLGTNGYGLVKSVHCHYIDHITNVEIEDSEGPFVWGIEKLPNSKIAISTKGEGLIIYNYLNRKKEKKFVPPGNNTKYNFYCSMYDSGLNRIFIGSSQGLYYCGLNDTDTILNKIKEHESKDSIVDYLTMLNYNDSSFFALKRIGDTIELALISKKNNKVIKSLGKDCNFNCLSISFDSTELLVGAENRFFEFNIKKDFHKSINEVDFGDVGKINCIQKFDENYTWLGTGKKGLLRYFNLGKEVDLECNTIKSSNKIEFLLGKDNVIYNLQQDVNKNVWFTSHRNISVINTKKIKPTIQHYSKEHAVLPNEFNVGESPIIDNVIYFGGVNGIVAVNLHKIDKSYKPKKPIIYVVVKQKDEENSEDNEKTFFLNNKDAVSLEKFKYAPKPIEIRATYLNYLDPYNNNVEVFVNEAEKAIRLNYLEFKLIPFESNALFSDKAILKLCANSSAMDTIANSTLYIPFKRQKIPVWGRAAIFVLVMFSLFSMFLMYMYFKWKDILAKSKQQNSELQREALLKEIQEEEVISNDLEGIRKKIRLKNQKDLDVLFEYLESISEYIINELKSNYGIFSFIDGNNKLNFGTREKVSCKTYLRLSKRHKNEYGYENKIFNYLTTDLSKGYTIVSLEKNIDDYFLAISKKMNYAIHFQLKFKDKFEVGYLTILSDEFPEIINEKASKIKKILNKATLEFFELQRETILSSLTINTEVSGGFNRIFDPIIRHLNLIFNTKVLGFWMQNEDRIGEGETTLFYTGGNAFFDEVKELNIKEFKSLINSVKQTNSSPDNEYGGYHILGSKELSNGIIRSFFEQNGFQSLILIPIGIDSNLMCMGMVFLKRQPEQLTDSWHLLLDQIIAKIKSTIQSSKLAKTIYDTSDALSNPNVDINDLLINIISSAYKILYSNFILYYPIKPGEEILMKNGIYIGDFNYDQHQKYSENDKSRSHLANYVKNEKWAGMEKSISFLEDLKTYINKIEQYRSFNNTLWDLEKIEGITMHKIFVDNILEGVIIFNYRSNSVDQIENKYEEDLKVGIIKLISFTLKFKKVLLRSYQFNTYQIKLAGPFIESAELLAKLHNLNNSFISINSSYINYLEDLKSDSYVKGKEREREKRYMTTNLFIKDIIRTMEFIQASIVDLEKYWKGKKVRVEKNNWPILDIIEDSINDQKLELDKYEYTIKDPPPGILINGDRNQLRQVFINIIKNAIDSIKLNNRKGKIEFSITSDGTFCTVSIKDNGNVIEEGRRNIIFEPFETTKGEKGTGIGLYISKIVIDDHGGVIRVKENAWGGSTFDVTLPEIKTNTK